MTWVVLAVAGLFEIGWAIGLKYTEGLTRFWPTVGTGLSMIISVVLLGIAMKTLPVGTAYAVWTGIGAVGTVLIGIALFNEPMTVARMLCVCLIVGGIIGLKVTSARGAHSIFPTPPAARSPSPYCNRPAGTQD
jgi:quaternary ammonium compound-resistance protein SugE